MSPKDSKSNNTGKPNLKFKFGITLLGEGKELSLGIFEAKSKSTKTKPIAFITDREFLDNTKRSFVETTVQVHHADNPSSMRQFKSGGEDSTRFGNTFSFKLKPSRLPPRRWVFIDD